MPVNALDTAGLWANVGRQAMGADRARQDAETNMGKMLMQQAALMGSAQKNLAEAEQTRQRMKYQTPEFASQIGRAVAGLNDKQGVQLDGFKRDGVWEAALPDGVAGPGVPTQAAPSWATPETLRRYDAGRAAHLLNLGGTGDTNAEQAADALAKILGQGRIDAAIANPKSIPVFGAAMAASDGKPLFHQGANGVMDQFTGAETMNEVGRSAARENLAQAGNAAASAALHRAQIPEVQSRIDLNRAKIGQSQTTTLPDGTVITTGLGANGVPPKLTEAQGKAQLFGSRAAEADKILTDLEGRYSPAGINSKMAAESVWGIGGALGAAGNKMLSADSQKAEQAQRDFVNAVLRLESGAVISPQEFDNAKKQYFPQPGDTNEVLAQKARNRRVAIEGLRVMAGPAADRVRPSSPPAVPERNPALNGVPVAAIEHLMANPQLRNAFAAKYGKAATDAALGAR